MHEINFPLKIVRYGYSDEIINALANVIEVISIELFLNEFRLNKGSVVSEDEELKLKLKLKISVFALVWKPFV